jgi:hypothetical protein
MAVSSGNLFSFSGGWIAEVGGNLVAEDSCFEEGVGGKLVSLSSFKLVQT